MIISLLHFLFWKYFSNRALDEPIVIPANSNIWTKQLENIVYERDVKLLIHGWNADPDHTSMQPVRNAYLRLNVSHVVSVDWRKIAGMPYIVARDLIGAIGKQICKIFKGFNGVMKVSSDRVHIVGHSLGKFLTYIFFNLHF